MGAYLEQLHMQGDPLVIVNAEAMVPTLQAIEDVTGHISWCRPISFYTDSDGRVDVAAILEDYGWATDAALDTPLAERDGAPFNIEHWKGDKIGLSWAGVLDALAAGVNPSAKTTIFCLCEGDLFAVCFHLGQATEHETALTVINPPF